MTYLYYTTILELKKIKTNQFVLLLFTMNPCLFSNFQRNLNNEITYSFNTPEEETYLKKYFIMNQKIFCHRTSCKSTGYSDLPEPRLNIFYILEESMQGKCIP